MLAGGALVGIGIGCVALAVLFYKKPDLVTGAVKGALEGPGLQVVDIATGSIVVKLQCATKQSFLSFMKDFEQKKVKQRLEVEFKKIGFENELEVTITNDKEVYKKLDNIREAIMADEEIDQLINKILNYEVGAYERFDDALPGEMEGFRLNIMFFGMTGSGKSALINNIFKSLGLSQPVVTQITGKEGTIILECCDLADGVTFYDSRGSLHLDEMEKGELFRILYGIERPGDNLSRGHASAQKAAAAGVGYHRLEMPPIADQMHVVVWVIKANDIRFERGMYREIINFVLHQLKRETITIITVITFDDEVQNMPNPDEERKKLEKAAIEVTGSAKRNIFFISNSVTDQEDLAPVYEERVLQMVEQALKCGELSIKMRQNQRESSKKMVHYSRSESEPGGRPLRVPVENTEPPAYPESLP